MKGVGKSIELEKLDENLNTFFTERAVSSSTLATPDVVISEPEFIMIGPFQYGKEIFSCDEYLSL